MLLTAARELCDQPHRQNKAISYEKAKIFTPSEINLGPKMEIGLIVMMMRTSSI